MTQRSDKPNYAEFSDPRLAALYDTINPFGRDSECFCQLAASLSAKTIIDLGCGTGLFTCELARHGHRVTGIEPSEAMLAVAQAKPYADQIKWIHGSFEQMEGLRADMVVMTSHVAQFFINDTEWQAMLQAAHAALTAEGHLVFDVRRLSNPPFASWPTRENRRRLENTIAGPVEWWFILLNVENGRVCYELHYFFTRSGQELVSLNELAFRSQDQVTQSLFDAGFGIKTIYGDWDSSPVRADSPEMIFVAQRR